MNEEQDQEKQEQELNIEYVAHYWKHRGFVGSELARRIQETLERGEIVDNYNDACRVCE